MGDEERGDALERTVFELEAMASIFNDDFADESEANDEKFVVTTPEALKRAQAAIDCGDHCDEAFDSPRIEVEVFVRSTGSGVNDGVRLRIGLPPGYPSMQRAEVTVLSIPKNLPRSHLDDMSTQLHCRTVEMELVGSEAIMEIVHECRDTLEDWETQQLSSHDTASNECIADTDGADGQTISRRWIWVHHITNTGRLKQIVAEAQSLQLGGFLKGGYPGVVVIEGNARACDEFVTWIKGNKSREGGFGRNWGHHVRGEAVVEERQLPKSFEELDDMGDLGALCAKFGVEDEFRDFILQHK